MKPKLVCRHGIWFCAGCGAWGSGLSATEAWQSWLSDKGFA